MATQFIKNNANFSDLEHWNGFSSIVEKDGFKSLNLKQINANYDDYIELKEESTYTLWCEINSTYLQQISTIKGLLFDCFFVKEDGSYDENNIYDAYAKFDIKSQERSLQPNKWQVIELRIVTKSFEQAKDEYTRIMFRPKFLFNNDEENGIDIYIKNLSFEDSDRRYYGNNLIVDSSKCENKIYKLNNVERTNYRYYGGYVFKTKDDIKGNVSFNVAKDLFKHRILRNGDKVKFSIFAKTNSEKIRYSNMAFYMKRYNINTQEDVESYFYRSEYVGDIDDIWRRFEFVFTVTSQMIDDSGNNLLWGDSGIFFNGKIEDEGVIYYACPMLEIVGDDSSFSEEWIPNKKDDIYNDYFENLIMSYGNYEKDIKLFIRKNGEQKEKEISYYTTSYEEEDSSSSNETFKLGNVGSKTVKIGIRNYDDNGNEIVPRDLTNYLLYVEKYYQNGYDDSGDIVVREGKYKVYENPEDFSNNMTIEFQDRMVELDIEYDSELEFPTTIRKQLEEITNKTNMLVDYSQIDESILNEEINFYDNTYTKREYLSWIGEKSSCNVFIDDDLVIFRKIDKQNIKEQYIDYASQDLKYGNEFRLRTVIFDNSIEYYSKSNDLMNNDDNVFTLKMENDTSELSINTNVKVNLEESKIYTFDFKSNISVIGLNNGEIRAKLMNLEEQYSIDINSFETTFKCLKSGEYTLWFYFNANKIGDVANFSNFHIVEGDIAYGLTNTFYVNNENMYITSQKDIDNIYSNVFGLDIVGCDNLSLIIGNPKIKAIDLVRMRFIDEMESEKFNKVPFVVYVSNHKLTFNKSFKSSFECPIQSTNEENTQIRKNVNTRIKKIEVNVDHNEQSLEIIAQDVEKIQVDVGDLNKDVIETNEKVAQIELDIDSINLSVSNVEKEIVTIGDNVSEVTKRLESAEIKLEPTNIILAVNTAIDDGQNIHSTKFQIDKDGVHISGGGIDVSDSNGNKVFYADVNGNLNLSGIIYATDGKIGIWEINSYMLANSFVSGVADGGKVGLSPGINPLNHEYNPYDGLCFWAGAYWDSNIGDVNFEKAPFRVYANGNLYASNATISGNISGSNISGSSFSVNRQRNAVVYGGDVDLIKRIIMGQYYPSEEEKKRLDFDLDKRISSRDMYFAEQMINNRVSKTFYDYININTDNHYPEVKVGTRSSDGKYVIESRLGVSSIETSSIYSDDLRTGYIETGRISFISDNNDNIAGVEITDFEDSNGVYTGLSISSLNKNSIVSIDSDFIRLYSYQKYIEIYGHKGVKFDASGSIIYFENTNVKMFRPQGSESGTIALGQTWARWGTLFTKYNPNVESDKRIKDRIEMFDEKYEKFFMNLKGVRYVLKSEPEKGYHCGFIAQEVEMALKNSGLENNDFNGLFKEYNKEKGYDEYSLAYGEFTSLNTHMIQKCLKYIKELEKELSITNSKLNAYINGNLETKIIK